MHSHNRDDRGSIFFFHYDDSFRLLFSNYFLSIHDIQAWLCHRSYALTIEVVDGFGVVVPCANAIDGSSFTIEHKGFGTLGYSCRHGKVGCLSLYIECTTCISTIIEA